MAIIQREYQNKFIPFFLNKWNKSHGTWLRFKHVYALFFLQQQNTYTQAYKQIYIISRQIKMGWITHFFCLANFIYHKRCKHIHSFLFYMQVVQRTSMRRLFVRAYKQPFFFWVIIQFLPSFFERGSYTFWHWKSALCVCVCSENRKRTCKNVCLKKYQT